MKDLSINTVMEYSPYDNKCPSPFGLRKSAKEEQELFYNNGLFVPYTNISKLQNELSSYVEDESTHTLVFFGASGSGKTTFLKDFFKNNENIYVCEFINLLDNPTIIDSDACVRTTIFNALGRVFNRDVAGYFYSSYLSYKTRKEEEHSAVEIMDFLGVGLTRFLAFCNLFSLENSRLTLHKIRDFNISTQQLVSLYIISTVIAYRNDSRPLVFVFDNLDEVDKQYINGELYDLIESAFSIAQDYCEKVLLYNFLSQITFLMSFRVDNERIFRSNETNDRNRILFSEREEFSYAYQVNYDDLLDARIRFYENIDGKDKELKNKCNEINALIKSEKHFFEQFIKPLYSYDYRMFTHYTIKEALRNRNVFIPSALKKQNKVKEAQLGARGMFLFFALAGMLRDDKSRFSTYVKEEFSDNLCNVYRMSFSLLSNMCGWSRNQEELIKVMKTDEMGFNEKTQPVHLPSFMEKITPWYSERRKDAISKILKGLIGSTASSYECPITLLGDDIFKYIKELKNEFSMSTFAAKVTQDYINDPDSLSSVTIQVNPLCIVYASRVFIHYEYFNLISTQWNNKAKEKKGMAYDPRPLFQLTSSEQDLKNIELCLAYTFETAKTIIENADKHFCKICGKRKNGQQCKSECKSSVEKFINDNLSFNKTLHATRIITNHIHYLESYRKFLWFQNTNDVHTDTEVEIQRIIINQILEYIMFYKRRCIRDGKYHWISKDWGDQYLNALATIDNQPQYFTEINLEFETKEKNINNKQSDEIETLD